MLTQEDWQALRAERDNLLQQVRLAKSDSLVAINAVLDPFGVSIVRYLDASGERYELVEMPKNVGGTPVPIPPPSNPLNLGSSTLTPQETTPVDGTATVRMEADAIPAQAETVAPPVPDVGQGANSEIVVPPSSDSTTKIADLLVADSQ